MKRVCFSLFFVSMFFIGNADACEHQNDGQDCRSCLVKERDDLRRKLNESNSFVKTLSKRRTDLITERARLRTEHNQVSHQTQNRPAEDPQGADSRAEQELVDLKNQLEAAKGENRRISEEQNKMTEQLKKNDDERIAFLKEKEGVEEHLQRALAALGEKESQLKSQLEQLKKNDAERIAFLKEKEGVEEHLQRALAALGEKESQLKSQLEQLKKNDAERIAFLKEKEGVEEHLRKELAALGEKESQLKSQLEAAKGENRRISEEQNKMTEQLKKNDVERIAFLKEKEGVEEHLRKELAALGEKESQLKSQLEAAKGENRRISEEQNKMTEQLKKNNVERIAFLQNVHYLENILNDNEFKLKELKEEQKKRDSVIMKLVARRYILQKEQGHGGGLQKKNNSEENNTKILFKDESSKKNKSSHDNHFNQEADYTYYNLLESVSSELFEQDDRNCVAPEYDPKKSSQNNYDVSNNDGTYRNNDGTYSDIEILIENNDIEKKIEDPDAFSKCAQQKSGKTSERKQNLGKTSEIKQKSGKTSERKQNLGKTSEAVHWMPPGPVSTTKNYESKSVNIKTRKCKYSNKEFDN